VIFTDYRGLTVKEISELRGSLRQSNLEYRVVKNTLAIKATEGTPLNGAKEFFSGPVGLAVGYDDPVLLAKKVIEFSKTNEKLKIKGGVIEGGLYRPEDIKTISELPTREALLSMFIGAMQSPLAKFANMLNAAVARFVYAMNALRQKKESS
jgi:large subunit ribosomal protein L10